MDCGRAEGVENLKKILLVHSRARALRLSLGMHNYELKVDKGSFRISNQPLSFNMLPLVELS